MSLTISSTTPGETLEDLQKAVGDDWRNPPAQEDLSLANKNGELRLDKLPAKKFIEIRDQQVAEKKDTGPEFLQGEENGKPGHKSGYEKRISKLTKNWRAEQSRAEAAERRAAELESRLSGAAPPERSVVPAHSGNDNNAESQKLRPESTAASSPKQYISGAEKFPDFADAMREADKSGISVSERAATAIRSMANPAAIIYFLSKNPAIASELLTNPDSATARVGEISRDLLYFHRDVERRGSQETFRQQELVRSHNRRVAAALSQEADRARLVESSGKMPIAPSVTAAILEQDNSDAVAIYFAKNPKILQELNQLPPSAAMSRVGRIAEQLAAKSAPQTKEKVRPPDPVVPVGASAIRLNIPLDELPIREFIKTRNQQERARRHY